MFSITLYLMFDNYIAFCCIYMSSDSIKNDKTISARSQYWIILGRLGFSLFQLKLSIIYTDNSCLVSLGVGYKWVIFCFIFATVFLYSICPISTWNDLFFGLGAKKKVRRAKIQNGRRFPWKITLSTITLSFVGLFVWFWCLTLCFGGQRFHLCS